MLNKGMTGIFLMTLVCLQGNFSQDNSKEKVLKEYVSVLNVELVLRVMQDGRAQGGFKREDFKLFENGKECNINGFFEIRRRMAAPPRPETAEKGLLKTGRFFLLLFWCHSSEKEIRTKLDHFFETIYQPSDRVVLGGTDRLFEVNQPDQREAVLTAFFSEWQNQIKRYDQELRYRYGELGHAATDTMDTLRNLDEKKPEDHATAIAVLQSLYQTYTANNREWQVNTNRLQIGMLEKLAENIGRINTDKWVLVFYERENRPLYRFEDLEQDLLQASRNQFRQYIRDCTDQVTKINHQIKSGSSFLSQIKAMQNPFTQAGAVFHLLQMSPREPQELGNDIAGTNVSAVNMEPVFSNWDAVFQSISQASGGQIVDLDKGIEELDRLAQLEDISYTLTYVPREKRTQERRIELRIVNPELKGWQKHLLYGRRLEMESLPELKVSGIRSDEKKMKIVLESFYPVNTTAGPLGHFTVSLAAEKSGTPAEVLYQQEVESAGEIEIPLQIEDPGDWTLWIRVRDLMSGQSVLEKRKWIVMEEEERGAAVPQTREGRDELGALLLKGAAYADRLKKTAMRFTCEEEVVEQVRKRRSTDPNQRFDRTVWQYDYQIVVDQGTLTENRLLMKKDRKKYSPPVPASLESFYEIQYSFFMPFTMLAAERQPQYIYSVNGKDRIRKRQVIRIVATPRDEFGSLPGGELWIDEEDGSVWKIVLDPKTVTGFRKRYASAKNRGVHLIMSDVHEYFERYGGIQFPSSVLVTENHTYTQVYEEHAPALDKGNFAVPSNKAPMKSPPVQLEVLRVHYSYEKYRFFEINTQTIIDHSENP